MQSMSKAWVCIAFQMNKEYIAAKLCENKVKPQMGCAGKCYLKKQLAKAQNAAQQLNEVMKDFGSTFYQNSHFQLFNCKQAFYFIPSVLNFIYTAHFPENLLEAVFRPPTVA
jgi:hypothetical protein